MASCTLLAIKRGSLVLDNNSDDNRTDKLPLVEDLLKNFFASAATNASRAVTLFGDEHSSLPGLVQRRRSGTTLAILGPRSCCNLSRTTTQSTTSTVFAEIRGSASEFTQSTSVPSLLLTRTLSEFVSEFPHLLALELCFR